MLANINIEMFVNILLLQRMMVCLDDGSRGSIRIVMEARTLRTSWEPQENLWGQASWTLAVTEETSDIQGRVADLSHLVAVAS